jgi:hypothetical protein
VPLRDVRQGVRLDAQDQGGEWYEGTIVEMRGAEVHIHCKPWHARSMVDCRCTFTELTSVAAGRRGLARHLGRVASEGFYSSSAVRAAELSLTRSNCFLD